MTENLSPPQIELLTDIATKPQMYLRERSRWAKTGRVLVRLGLAEISEVGMSHLEITITEAGRVEAARRGIVPAATLPPPAGPHGDTTCERCSHKAAGTCCTSHNKHLCHHCYRKTHFVEKCVKACKLCAAEQLPQILSRKPTQQADEPKDRVVSFRLTQPEYDFLHHKAQIHGQTVTELIRTTLAQVPAWNVEWHYLPHPDPKVTP